MKNTSEKSLTLWEALDRYADIRDEFDQLLIVFSSVQGELLSTAGAIREELNSIQKQLKSCDQVFRRYKVKDSEATLH